MGVWGPGGRTRSTSTGDAAGPTRCEPSPGESTRGVSGDPAARTRYPRGGGSVPPLAATGGPGQPVFWPTIVPVTVHVNAEKSKTRSIEPEAPNVPVIVPFAWISLSPSPTVIGPEKA